MRVLLATPANNERGPRYLEKALAAIHQSRLRTPITLAYSSVQGRVGLLVECGPADRELVLGPIAANYPQCELTEVPTDDRREACETWSVALQLVPELFPLLRHAQFEDALNRTYADPLGSLLRAIRPDDRVTCRVEITIAPASSGRCHAATEAVKRLDRAFFREHHRLAAFYARHYARTVRIGYGLAWLLGRVAVRSAHPTTPCWKPPRVASMNARTIAKPPPTRSAVTCSRPAFA